MTSRKIQKVQALSKTGAFYNTFHSILEAIPADLQERLTAAELAAVIDFGAGQVDHGHTKGYFERRGVTPQGSAR